MSIMSTVETIVGDAKNLVSTQLDRVNDIADSQLDALTQDVRAITDAWQNLTQPTWPDEPEPPEVPTIEDITPNQNVGAQSFGSMPSGSVPSMPSLDLTVGQSAESFPDFETQYQMNVVEPPTLTFPASLPAAPDINDVTLPTAPVIDFPLLPTLTGITVPEFTFPTLLSFDDTAPEFVETPLTYLFEYAEPVYETEVLDEVLVQVRAMMDGGLGLSPEVEQALWERAAAREDLAVAREVANAAIEFASRGFTAPPGMVAARVDAVREEGMLKKLALNRDITIEVAKIRVENTKFAVSQGVACEQLLINLFTNQAQRSFEIARAVLQAQLDVYNARVAVFNARMNAYSIRAQVYKIQLDAQLAELQVFRARIDGEIAKGQLNEQLVRMYSAQVQAITSRVDVYRAEMEGARVASDVDKNRIEGYRARVAAYAEEINTNKIQIDLYDVRVRGESAKAAFIDAEVKAYQAVIQGKTAVIEQNVKNAELLIQGNRATVESFRAQIEASTASGTLSLQAIEANTKAYIANTARWAAEAGANSDLAKVRIAAYETASQANVSQIDAATKRYTAQIDYLLRRAQMSSDSASQAARIASTVAAGAMSAVNLGASMNASGAAGMNFGVNFGKNAQESYSYNVSSKGDDGGSPVQQGNLANQPW